MTVFLRRIHRDETDWGIMEARYGTHSLILWSADAYAESFQTTLRTPCVPVTSQRQLMQSLNALHPPINVAILAELDWNGQQRSEFVGVDLLCELRFQHGLRCPIAVCSFMSERSLRGRFPVLKFAANHPFIRLPVGPTEVMEALHGAELADDARIHHILQYCDPFGRVERLITHGAGLSALHRAASEPTLSDTVWRALEEDAVLLSKYLNTDALGDSATEAGGQLLRGVQAAIRDRPSDALREVRTLLTAFHVALRSARPS